MRATLDLIILCCHTLRIGQTGRPVGNVFHMQALPMGNCRSAHLFLQYPTLRADGLALWHGPCFAIISGRMLISASNLA